MALRPLAGTLHERPTVKKLAIALATSMALLALSSSSAHADEARPAQPPRAPVREELRRVTFTVDGSQLISFTPLVLVTSDARLSRRWSIAVSGGGGARANAWPAHGSKLAWELGAEPRWYFSGSFNSGFYVGWATFLAGSHGSQLGYESLAPPPGLSTGAFVGFKSVYVPIITPDVELGLVTPLVTPSSESSPPPIAIVGRLGIGFSL